MHARITGRVSFEKGTHRISSSFFSGEYFAEFGAQQHIFFSHFEFVVGEMVK